MPGLSESMTDKSYQDRGRTRDKRSGENRRENAEFFNQMAETMQHLQRDLDRITGRVRSLEGQALQSLAPQSVILFSLKAKYLSKF